MFKIKTNLIGRKFTASNRSELTVVAIYISDGRLLIVGESTAGSLNSYNLSEVNLKPAPPEENLRGVI